MSSVEAGRAKLVESSYQGPLFTWRMFNSSVEQSEEGLKISSFVSLPHLEGS